MFSIESYLTPYIGAYLGKYVKNFNETQFELSLWQGGATFNNVNLNLDAIEEELRLPFHLLSGRIHELKISVPWTKLTSEPIVVNINTIEITFALGHPNSSQDELPQNSHRLTAAAAKKRAEGPELPPKPPGYMQSLINKVIQNVKFVCQNVILKYVERDLVFSLNVKKVTLCSVNGEWDQAFVEPMSPDFLLRQKLSCSDLTVCLDKADNFGRISYLDPVLYKCSFDIRILSQFHGSAATVPFFTRLDVLINDMEISMADEQIPMALRLYYCIRALMVLEPRPELIKGVDVSESSEDVAEDQIAECEATAAGGEGHGFFGWASWAVGLVPQVLLGDVEPDEPTDPCEFDQPVFHIGFHVNNTTVTFKGNETYSDRSSNGPSSRCKNLPYLRFQFQGILGDVILRGRDSHSAFGVSKVILEGIASCPCGTTDCEDDSPPDPSISNNVTYLSFGNENDWLTKNTLFDPSVEVRPTGSYKFQYEGHEEQISKEQMLARTPAVAVDAIEVLPTEPSEAEMLQPLSESSALQVIDRSHIKSMTRVLFSSWQINICTGLIHRIKRVCSALMTYDFVPYEELAPIAIPKINLLYKIHLDKFQIVMHDGASGKDVDSQNQIVAEFSGLKTDIHLQVDITRVKLQLQNLDIRSYEIVPGGDWKHGECLGVVLSSGNDLQNSITVANPTSFQEKPDEKELNTGTMKPGNKFTATKFEDMFSFTFTRVPTSDFLKRSGLPSPNAKFNTTLEKHFEVDITEFHVPPNQNKFQFISEFDVKLKPFDVALTSAVIKPFVKLFKEISTVSTCNEESSGSQEESAAFPLRIPSFNNNTLPLFYLEGGRFRLFLKADSSALTPDTTVIQFSSAVISSQSENPLHRSLLRPEIFALAQEANIVSIPGSPIEDRQYLMDLSELSISACTWKDIESTSPSARLENNRYFKESVKQIPRTSEFGAQFPLVALPILNKLDICFSYSPAIVYERHPRKMYHRQLVGGHAFELNISTEINILLNVRQINLFRALLEDLKDMSSTWTALGVYQPEVYNPSEKEHEHIASENSSVREVDSGIESGTGTGTVSSAVARPRKYLNILPLDVFLAAPLIRITTYHLIRKDSTSDKSLEQDLESIVAVTPLVQVVLGQPYFVRAVTIYAQRLELSFYDARVLLGPGRSLPRKGFTIPAEEDYPNRLFQTVEGERDERTGIVPPIFVCKAVDFANRPCDCRVEIEWPVKISMCKKRVDLIVDIYNCIRNVSAEEAEAEAEAVMEQESPHTVRSIVNLGMRYLTTLRVSLKQVLVIIHEEPPGLPKAALHMSLSGLELFVRAYPRIGLSGIESEPEEKIQVNVQFDSIVVTTTIGERTDVFMNPWNAQLTINAEWHAWIAIPITSLSFKTDPLSVFLGPQNILAFLQIYHSFGNYIQRFLEAEEEEFLEILDALPFANYPTRNFKDDMRSGALRFVDTTATPTEQPNSYQITFSTSQGTMTWRYPDARSLIRIETLAMPILAKTTLLKTKQNNELRCVMEYWDDCQHMFLEYAELIFKKDQEFSVPILDEEGERLVSTTWRLSIRTEMEEEDKKLILSPLVLAAALRVDSAFSPKLVQKLRLYVEIPRFSLHLVNHFTYGGKIPEDKLNLYSITGLPQMDQPVATLELSMTTFYVNMWWQRATVDVSTFTRLSVVDYAYLTNIDVIDPFEFQLKYKLFEDEEKQVYSGFQVLSKPITIKIGGSALHTAISSIMSWMQALKAYYGSRVDTSKNHFQYQLNMTQMLVCNDTSSQLGLIQIDTKKPQLIPSRHCFAYNWTTQKVRPECRVGLYEGTKWIWSESFGMNRVGLSVRKIGQKFIFIKIERLYASQRMITMYGSVTFANALEWPIQVGLFSTQKAKERRWVVDARSHGPSQLVTASDVEQFRFKLHEPAGYGQAWSHSIFFEDLLHTRNQTKCFQMFRVIGGELIIYNYWCSLVQEKVEYKDTHVMRSMIVVSPFFRARSALAVPMSGKVTTARGDDHISFVLSGRGEGNEVDYVGSHELVHHLTFQQTLTAPPSSPALPLLPGGPALENIIPIRPIDEILKDILSVSSRNTEEERWPYTGDKLDIEQWSLGTIPEAGFEANFTPWIEGLPSVLVDVKPWALFMNLTGEDIFFQEACECRYLCHKCSPVHQAHTRSAFSPLKKRGKFYFGIDDEKSERRWSGRICITDEYSQTDVHNINSNWKIPVGYFGRLEIRGDNQMTSLTIETKFHNGIFLLIIRPTYNIQNLTELPLSVKGVSISGQGVPDDKYLAFTSNVHHLEPNDEKDINSATCQALLTFNCDWDPEFNVYNKVGLKYIGIKYGSGPFWFVQLMRFEALFNNVAATPGVTVKRSAVSIPNCQPQWAKGQFGDLVGVQIPLSVCWTSRSGQVWIAISLDEAPQVVIHNETQGQLVYAEGGDLDREALHFPQFHCLPPFSQGYYTFPSSQKIFPELLSCYTPPSLLIGRYIKGVEELFQKVKRYNMLCRLDERLEWSNPLRVENVDEFQLIQVGKGKEQLDLKVHIEKLGLIYYIYIEELSEIEVSAKDVRMRINDRHAFDSIEVQRPGKPRESRNVKFAEPAAAAAFAPGEVLHVLSAEELQIEIESSNFNLPSLSTPPSKLAIAVGTGEHPYVRSYYVFPEIRIILTDDFTHAHQKREFISITSQDVYIERKPKTGNKRLRALDYKPAESWSLAIRIGDIQVDNALYQEKRYDFPVLLKNEADYICLAPLANYPFENVPDLFDSKTQDNHRFMVYFDGEFSLFPSNTEKLYSVVVQCEPFTINVEDQFLEYIYPAIAEFIKVITERIPQIKKEHLIIQAQRNPSARKCPPNYEDSDGMEMYSVNVEYAASVKALTETNDYDVYSSTNSLALGSRRVSLSELVNRSRSRNETSSSLDTNSFRSRDFGGSAPDLRSHYSYSGSPVPSQRLDSAFSSRRNSLQSTENVSLLGRSLQDLTTEDYDDNAFTDYAVLSTGCQRYLPVPKEIIEVINDLSHPIRMDLVYVQPVTIFVTIRMSKRIYLAIDHSPLYIHEFRSNYVVTTHFTMGDTIAKHFITGAIYKSANPVRLIGSLELLGNPAMLVRSLGSGVKDFVVYPLKGIARGPLGFITGLNHGCFSLVRHISVGTLTSVTNWAWSVSRNIDRLTLSIEEQQQTEEDRRIPIDGVADGLSQGLSGFGIRLLGAVGGLAHHPMQAVTQPGGASTMGVIGGIGKGLFGFVAKPIGATVELVAKTGLGLLKGAGWTPDYKRKYDVHVDDALSRSNSFLKYSWKLGLADGRGLGEKILLVVDATEPGRNGQLTPVSLVITTENVYIMDTLLDQVQRQESIESTTVCPTDFYLDPSSSTEFFSILQLARRIQRSQYFNTL